MPSVKEFYEKTAEVYDKEYDEPYWKLYHDITWANIRRFLPRRKNATILDAGGGTGYWAIRLAKRGFNVVSTDIAENMLKVATRKIEEEKLQDKIKTRIADITDMSCFKSDCFDMALAEGDPVSYCLHPQKAVRELARVVKDGSYVIVSVDSKYPIVSRLIREEFFDELPLLLRTGRLKGDFMIQAFTPEEMRALFETCGLNVVRMIGKPVLTQSIPKENRDKVIGKEFRQLLKLELKFCDAPSLVGTGGHLEVVGVKRERRSARSRENLGSC